MSTPHTYRLSPAEVLSLWNTYLTHSMTTYVTKYMLKTAEDAEVTAMLEMALAQSNEGLAMSTAFFENAGHPLPEAFDERDVNMDAPKAYTDDLVLLIKSKLAQDANVVLSMSLATSTRPDIRAFYNKALKDCADLMTVCDELIHKKGLDHPEMHIPVPERIEKVETESFLGSVFTGTRPLSAAELFHLIANFRSTAVVAMFCRSFAQISTSNKFREHYKRGEELFNHQLEVFQANLTENGLPKMPTLEGGINETDVSPFSERLMMFKMAILTAATAGRYGVALSTVMRKDIGVDFMRLLNETLLYGKANIDLMIENGYLDQHPLAKQ